MQDRIRIPCIFTIFAEQEIFTCRKLIPALYNMSVDGLLPDEFMVVCVGRKPLSTQEHGQPPGTVTSHSCYPVRTDIWNGLKRGYTTSG